MREGVELIELELLLGELAEEACDWSELAELEPLTWALVLLAEEAVVLVD